MTFATLDDSSREINGIHIYAHAIVTKWEVYSLIIEGEVGKLQNVEEQIYDFVSSHVSGKRLYPCKHYSIYSSISPYVLGHINDHNINNFRRPIRMRFKLAHQAAWTASKLRMAELSGLTPDKSLEDRVMRSRGGVIVGIKKPGLINGSPEAMAFQA